MELAVAATLYLTFGAWLTLPTLGAPAVFPRLCIRLCAAEFIAACLWAGTESPAWGTVATLHIPIAAALLGALSLAYAVFVVRGW